MEWVETTARTIEEAKDRALDQLGVDEADAEFEIVSEPKSGFLGRLKAEARVRARVRPTSPRPKDSGGSRQRKRRNDRDRSDRPARSQAKSPAASNEGSEVDVASEQQDREDHAGQAASGKSRSRSRSRNKPTSRTEGASAMEENVALDHQSEIAKDFLTGFLSEIQATATVAVSIDEEDEIIAISVEGPELGHLIGPRGVALNALQDLTRTTVQRKTGARNGRILVDVAQYREKRRAALERFSIQVADEVKASSSPKVLEPMNPADRKVVHDVINGIEGVVTTSEGEEPRRRVVISPAE